jgi:hypothetical protein
MARGGYRPGAGRPKGSKSGEAKVVIEAPKKTASRAVPDAEGDAQSPLDYMLSVMRDPEIDGARKDRMAIAAAPFMHARADTAKAGKKEQRTEAAAVIATGRFGARPSPLKVVGRIG